MTTEIAMVACVRRDGHAPEVVVTTRNPETRYIKAAVGRITPARAARMLFEQIGAMRGSHLLIRFAEACER